VYPDETHVSVQLKTVYDGLRYLYRGYNTRIEFHPMNGTVLQDKPFKIMGLAPDNDMRYTTDGTEPTAASGKVAGQLTLPGPSILKVKSITGGGRFDKVVTGQFKAGQVPPTGKLPKKATPGGLRYAYYPGGWDALPDFRKLKPAQSGRMDGTSASTSCPPATTSPCSRKATSAWRRATTYLPCGPTTWPGSTSAANW
jgi:hypothetical protein